MLIAPLQIKVGGSPQIGPGFQHAGVAHPGIKPDIQDIGLFPKGFPPAMRAKRPFGEQIFLRERKPDIGALKGNQVLQMG
jgi:hypothetical protein